MSTSASDVSLCGGELCLDFTNTVGWHAGDDPEEKLNSYEDLLVWSQRVGIVTSADRGGLEKTARDRPEDALAALEEARRFRAVLYRTFSAVVESRAPQAEDLVVFNHYLGLALGSTRLEQAERGFRLGLRPPADPLVLPLLTIARSAADLMTSTRLERVKRCADDSCGWFFLDRSKNRSRRWCDMSDCGNRAKARRYYRSRRRAD